MLRRDDDRVVFSDTRCRTQQSATVEQPFGRCLCGVDQFDTEFGRERETGIGDRVIGNLDCNAMSQECANGRLAGDSEAVYERCHKPTATF